MLAATLRPVAYGDLPGWDEDDLSQPYRAFRRSAMQALERPCRSGALGIEFSAFAPAHADARRHGDPAPGDARAFFERHFTPCRVVPHHGGAGFVTGFYEPVVRASRTRTRDFAVPLLRRPDDLVEIGDGETVPDLEPGYRFACRTPRGLAEYPDRRAIETGALSGRGLELAWLAGRVDAFFIHVQGAARLEFDDGTTMRVTFDGKSGQPFTGPGRVLADAGEIPAGEVTMQSIRAWFDRNPGRIDEILWHNRSYIFFRESEPGDPGLGPFAAAKVQLTPGRSLAVDRLLHTFGTPIHVAAPGLTAFGGKPFARLMIAQDTGSAIVGPARGDIFAGSGAAAGEIAGVVRDAADFFALVPRTLIAEGRI